MIYPYPITIPAKAGTHVSAVREAAKQAPAFAGVK
jgi:hypothetical protein